MEVLQNYLPLIGILGFLLAAGWLVNYGLSNLKSGSPYQLRASILTPTETRFWKTLQSCLPPNTILAIKPRLADIFETIPCKNRSRWQTNFNKISAKHVDFLLISTEGKPLLAFELDDPSHRRTDRIARDKFVEGIFQKCGMPLLRIPTKKSYPVGVLKTQIQSTLQMSKTSV